MVDIEGERCCGRGGKSEKARRGKKREEEEEQDVRAGGFKRCSLLVGIGKGGCAGEETVPGAEDERRDYPGRSVGPTDRPAEVRSRVRSARYGKTLNDRLTSLRFLPCFCSTRTSALVPKSDIAHPSIRPMYP